MRCYAAARGSLAGTATVGVQLEGAANHPFYVVECGVFNTTTTAFVANLSKYSVGGTAGAAITEVCEDETFTPLTVATQANTTAATLLGGPYVQASIGAAIGAGVIWTFGSKGLRVTGATDEGMTIPCLTGTGQVYDFYWVWEE